MAACTVWLCFDDDGADFAGLVDMSSSDVDLIEREVAALARTAVDQSQRSCSQDEL